MNTFQLFYEEKEILRGQVGFETPFSSKYESFFFKDKKAPFSIFFVSLFSFSFFFPFLNNTKLFSFLLFLYLKSRKKTKKHEKMNFEDIVDMDWLNSHTTDTSLPSPPPTTMNEDEEMIHYNDNEFSNSSMDCTPSTTTGSTTAAVSTILSTTTGGPIIMPTTEQIKQLIELAKRQLALREQAQQQSSLVIDTAAIIAAEPTPEPDSPPPGTNMVKLEELFTTPTVSPESLIKTDYHIIEHQEAVSLVEEAVVKMEPIEEEAVVKTTATTATNTTAVETERETKETATKRRDSFASHISDEGPMSLEAYAETDGIDIKKLTSKERRQLRNKISARNFRVRRKGESLLLF